MSICLGFVLVDATILTNCLLLSCAILHGPVTARSSGAEGAVTMSRRPQVCTLKALCCD